MCMYLFVYTTGQQILHINAAISMISTETFPSLSEPTRRVGFVPGHPVFFHLAYNITELLQSTPLYT